MSSRFSPVRTLTTPPGTSDVARTSLRVTAGSGRVSEVSRTTVLPETSGGASRLTRPSSDDVSGATTPTTPVGSGIVKLKYGAATGFDEPRTWAILSAQPAYQTQRSMARSTAAVALASRQTFSSDDLGDELVAPALHQLRDAVEDLAAVHRGPVGPARERPCARPARHRAGPCARRGTRSRGARRRRSETRYDRPLSVRGNAPPMYSL